MFSDIGALEVVALVILALLIWGPDKLPQLIQDVSRFIRRIREFSDNAKQDIRSELGPEFKDFEFEDLNPKTFLRKQLAENQDLKEIQELRSSFDLRKEIDEVADAVKGKAVGPAAGPVAGAAAAGAATPDLLKKRDPSGGYERPPFDADAT
ncbi:sec-independent translocase [Streptomyces fradiae]|uniref:sec-independent translocase n=1 Tax=Streptomyces fradiae TaxID=1906 RepID=UPI0029436F2B|nr:sec-independent translocase [Streptomyces fradiae]WOI62618.1 sec-independent translocase [Streptomyces fradiae]